MRNDPTIVILVNIPALSDLVAYLRTNQQAQIDAITAKVATADAKLSTSEAALESALPTAPRRK